MRVGSDSFTLDSDFSTRTACDAWLTVQAAVCAGDKACFTTNTMTVHRDFEEMKFSKSSECILNCPNAGGQSDKSEAMSFEMLRRVFGAELVKTEMEIEYDWCISKRTDFSVRMFDKKDRDVKTPILSQFSLAKRAFMFSQVTKVGVSVTRAYKHAGDYTDEDAVHLLTKKLYGVKASTKDVTEMDAWKQQILHVWVPSPHILQCLARAYGAIAVSENKDQRDLLSNTVVLCTLVKNADWIFSNKCKSDEKKKTATPTDESPRGLASLTAVSLVRVATGCAVEAMATKRTSEFFDSEIC